MEWRAIPVLPPEPAIMVSKRSTEGVISLDNGRGLVEMTSEAADWPDKGVLG
jgi:hypothetical protein